MELQNGQNSGAYRADGAGFQGLCDGRAENEISIFAGWILMIPSVFILLLSRGFISNWVNMPDLVMPGGASPLRLSHSSPLKNYGHRR